MWKGKNPYKTECFLAKIAGVYSLFNSLNQTAMISNGLSVTDSSFHITTIKVFRHRNKILKMKKTIFNIADKGYTIIKSLGGKYYAVSFCGRNGKTLENI